MELMVVLLCLLTQHVLVFEFHKPQFEWIIGYANRLESLCSKITWWQGLGGVLVLLGSIAVIYLMVIGILSLLLGMTFTFLFHFCVFWYYWDVKPLTPEAAHQMPLTALFMNRYHAIFAILFWYIILGPLAVILYAESRRLEAHLKAQQETDIYFSEDFLHKLILVRSLMDWLPVRLLGLTYALVGQFRPVFTYWCSRFVGLHSEPFLVVDYGMVALNWDPNLALSSTEEQQNEIKGLTLRALTVWLVVIAVFTLGRFIA